MPGCRLNIKKQNPAFQELRVYREDLSKQKFSEGGKSNYSRVQGKRGTEVGVFTLVG